jgi:hypothetical protein
VANEDSLPAQIVEADHNSGLLEILALTQSGTWEPIVTIAINEPEIVNRYRTPLLLRFGYSQTFQSDCPQTPGRSSGVMPQSSLPEQSNLSRLEATGSADSSE